MMAARLETISVESREFMAGIPEMIGDADRPTICPFQGTTVLSLRPACALRRAWIGRHVGPRGWESGVAAI
jgi:hypothetical protein